MGYWSNNPNAVNEYCSNAGPVEFALPNSKIGFFDECAVQSLHDENPDSERFVLDEDLNEPYNDIASYIGHMMRSSGELMTFSVGGPRFFENNAIIECFNEWT